MQNIKEGIIYLKAGINWWGKGLSYLIPTWLGSVLSNRKERVLIKSVNDKVTLSYQNAREIIRTSNFDLKQASDINNFKTEVKEINRKKMQATLLLDSSKGLAQILNFPLQAERSLNKILYYELEKVTPFKPEQLYYGYRIRKKNKNTKLLHVEFHAVPKVKLEPFLSTLKEYNLEPEKVFLKNNKTETGINLISNQDNSSKNSSWKRINIALLFCIFSLSLTQIILPFLQVEKKIKLTEKSLSTVKQEADIANELKVEWSDIKKRNQAIYNRINAFQPVILILNEMTDILPNTSWLTDFTINNKQIQIRGESSSASSLIPLIEQSSYFENTRFRSPVMTQTTGKETFQIITHRREEKEQDKRR